MKQFAFAVFSMLVLAMFSCKKDYPTIQTYDGQNIQSYISANNLTMTKGDSGIYYQIIKPGNTGTPLTDTDRIFYSYTVKTLDGKYISTDTVLNRVSNYVGLNSFPVYYGNNQNTYFLPVGLQFGIKKYLQKRNGIIRLLIPSNQAYHISGYTSPGGLLKVGGNESLDYTVYLYNVQNQLAYDTVQIRNYIKQNKLTGFVKSPTGLYYKIIGQGSGIDQIYSSSSVSITYTKRLLLSGTVVESKSLTNSAMSSFNSSGFIQGLEKLNSGGKIRMLIPSVIGYGPVAASTVDGDYNYNVPPNSILDFDVEVTAVTN